IRAKNMKSKKLLRKKEPSSVDSRLRISGMTDEKASPSEEGGSVFIVIWCCEGAWGSIRLPPSLHRHYPASSVLRSNPTPYQSFGILTWYRLSAILLLENRQGLPGCRIRTMSSVPGSQTPGKPAKSHPNDSLMLPSANKTASAFPF
ncbi:MAG: hypothetical protein PWP04_1285, partial [Candidatus Atribacteria bacterium]|nr:hypothetical protein [Candidatus Atribacteria bacterium]